MSKEKKQDRYATGGVLVPEENGKSVAELEKKETIIPFTDVEMVGDFPVEKNRKELEIEEEVTIPRAPLSETKIKIYTTSDIIAAFESGAEWQRAHRFAPHAMNAVEAHKEALAHWPT